MSLRRSDANAVFFADTEFDFSDSPLVVSVMDRPVRRGNERACFGKRRSVREGRQQRGDHESVSEQRHDDDARLNEDLVERSHIYLTDNKNLVSKSRFGTFFLSRFRGRVCLVCLPVHLHTRVVFGRHSMGGCLTRPLDARCIDIVRPALSKDDKAQAILEQSSPSHLLQRLSPLDSALCVRGLVVYWAFGFDRELDPDVIRASLASTLVKYPALAGRARVRARRGATLDLDVDLDMSNPNCGVPFEVCVDASTTLADLQRNGPEPGKNNITPSKLFVPLDIRCCEKGSTLCAVRVTKLAGATDAPDAKPATVLAVSWSVRIFVFCFLRPGR